MTDISPSGWPAKWPKGPQRRLRAPESWQFAPGARCETRWILKLRSGKWWSWPYEVWSAFFLPNCMCWNERKVGIWPTIPNGKTGIEKPQWSNMGFDHQNVDFTWKNVDFNEFQLANTGSCIHELHEFNHLKTSHLTVCKRWILPAFQTHGCTNAATVGSFCMAGCTEHLFWLVDQDPYI